ncbi:MAG: hypothetical protein LUC37_02150 [Prevotella sp.]|nr:hypothetical protein [Prevotella sp.]
MLRCDLYPNCDLFVTTGGKEQAASITKGKVEQICNYIPGLRDEIDFNPGSGTKATRDQVVYKFKNGSQLDIVAASERTRGQRRHGGLIEEAILVDGDILNTVIIPTMNVSRRLPDGTTHEEETLNKSQIYVKKFFGQKRLSGF